eukprot:1784495-Amphidinium_carterae.1
MPVLLRALREGPTRSTKMCCSLRYMHDVAVLHLEVVAGESAKMHGQSEQRAHNHWSIQQTNPHVFTPDELKEYAMGQYPRLSFFHNLRCDDSVAVMAVLGMPSYTLYR